MRVRVLFLTAAVKHILRYIAGSMGVGVFYPRRRGERVELHGYSDSDLAGDLDSRKSTSGVLFFLGMGPVSWQSTKQRVVALLLVKECGWHVCFQS
jgi:hypothetical protein